ncbi:MAG: hypothetical protein K2O62_02330, partial [Clostridia bacterium]|nr:hypothetical protein [Clostridia bacterium]
MKKKSIIALLLACSFAFGAATFTGCNVIGGGDKTDQNQTDYNDKNDNKEENKKPDVDKTPSDDKTPGDDKTPEDENKKPED